MKEKSIDKTEEILEIPEEMKKFIDALEQLKDSKEFIELLKKEVEKRNG